MTERKEDSYDVSILSNSELMRQLPLEHQIMQITNPAIGEEKIFALTLNMSLDDQMLVEIANNFIKPLYQDKIRKYSDTPAILHPYRLVLAGDTTAGYRIATKLLHDVMEDFDVSEETIRGLFKEVNGGIDGERIIKGVKAFTREKKVDGGQEDYDEYIKRLRKTAGEDLYQT